MTTIALVLALAVIGVLAYAATRPDSFRIQRSIQVEAPPDRIFALVDDLQSWRAWSPWENIDPALKRSYSGPAGGKGAVYAWEGNNKVGSGRMEITTSTPVSVIVIKLDFLKPFEAHNTAEFTFTASGAATTVSWAMYGPSNFVSKLMGLVFSMERMVGGQFEQGLAKLKALAESLPPR